MRSLVLRVAAIVGLTLVVAFFTAMWLLAPGEDFMSWYAEDLRRSGIGAVLDDVAAAPADQREAVLEGWRQHVEQGLAIAPPSPGHEKPWVEESGDDAHSVHYPFDGGELVVGPVQRPPREWSRALQAAAATGLIVLASAWIVVLPIARRLGHLEAASRAIERGRLETRVPVRGNDVIARLGTTFNHMAEGLERRVRDREDLLQAVAHEYGTPLARLSFSLTMLEDLANDDATRARIDDIRGDVGDLGKLTDELVEWLRADAPAPARFDVGDALREAAGNVGSARISVEPGPPVALFGDERQFRRAIENLLRNADRYARERVVIRTEADDAEARVIVDDDGPGIPEAERSRVFEPFARVDASRGRAGGGIGLGLSIVKRIVERHGGSALIEASPLGGARVVTRWPLVSAA